jgi:site-specific recombinase XerD
MLESLRVLSQIRTRIQSGPLGPYVDGFVTALQREGYTLGVTRRYVRAADVFGRWLSSHGITAQEVDEAVITRFVTPLRWTRSPSRPRGVPPAMASGVRKLAAFLWTEGVAVRRTVLSAEPAWAPWLRSFDEYLTRVAGLSAGTRHIYVRYARAFLGARFGTAAPNWATLAADAIADFVRVHAARLTPFECRAPVTATRAFLRFLSTTGVVRPGLDGAVPTVRQWTLATLPRALTAAELERVFASCHDTRATGPRDRAVLLLLGRLGLRASEVAALQREDIDWREGRIRIRAGKSDRDRSLPLLRDVGEALVASLRRSRPTPECRAVFMSARPPHRPLTAGAIGDIALRALHRAGVTVHRPGAHTLRHTAATQMVRRGVPFKAVADVLGHARLTTTAIYAKLDVDTLAAVALPWPGGER